MKKKTFFSVHKNVIALLLFTFFVVLETDGTSKHFWIICLQYKKHFSEDVKTLTCTFSENFTWHILWQNFFLTFMTWLRQVFRILHFNLGALCVFLFMRIKVSSLHMLSTVEKIFQAYGNFPIKMQHCRLRQRNENQNEDLLF